MTRGNPTDYDTMLYTNPLTHEWTAQPIHSIYKFWSYGCLDYAIGIEYHQFGRLKSVTTYRLDAHAKHPQVKETLLYQSKRSDDAPVEYSILCGL